jgi:hypothetical protein
MPSHARPKGALVAESSRSDAQRMSAFQTLSLTPAEAAAFLARMSTEAAHAWRDGAYDSAVDGYTRALGLALQLGPAPAEQVLTAIVDTTRVLESREEGNALAILGPALVDLVVQVRKAGALPASRVMEAWAELSHDLGAFIGQAGLAYSLPRERRSEIAANARMRAALLDDASNDALRLRAWLDAKELNASGASCQTL